MLWGWVWVGIFFLFGCGRLFCMSVHLCPGTAPGGYQDQSELVIIWCDTKLLHFWLEEGISHNSFKILSTPDACVGLWAPPSPGWSKSSVVECSCLTLDNATIFPLSSWFQPFLSFLTRGDGKKGPFHPPRRQSESFFSHWHVWPWKKWFCIWLWTWGSSSSSLQVSAQRDVWIFPIILVLVILMHDRRRKFLYFWSAETICNEQHTVHWNKQSTASSKKLENCKWLFQASGPTFPLVH